MCLSQSVARGLLSDRFHFLGVAVFQDLKDLLVDSIFLKTSVFFFLTIMWDVNSVLCAQSFSGKDMCRRDVAEVLCPTASIFSDSQPSKIWKIFYLIRFETSIQFCVLKYFSGKDLSQKCCRYSDTHRIFLVPCLQCFALHILSF
jgi:hypothetical protein